MTLLGPDVYFVFWTDTYSVTFDIQYLLYAAISIALLQEFANTYLFHGVPKSIPRNLQDITDIVFTTSAVG